MHKQLSSIVVILVPLLSVRTPSAEPAGHAVTLRRLLAEMTDRAAQARLPDPPYRSLQASTYNRESVRRGKPGWFADSDGTGFIRTEVIDGRTEWVLLEHEGPGAITRMWTPYFYMGLEDRKGPNVRIYLDGNPVPVLDESFIELLTGKGSFPPPFGAQTARAGDAYLPIPFARSCKVTLSSRSFYAIINYRAYPPGTAVETFRAEHLTALGAEISSAGKALQEALPLASLRSLEDARDLAPGAAQRLDLPPGPSAVGWATIRLTPRVPGAESYLRSTVLHVECDGHSTIWCPVGDFFCCADSLHPYHTWQRTADPDGTMTCRWVMPYRASARVSIENLGRDTVASEVRVGIAPWTWEERSLHFHAAWRPDDLLPGTPFLDWNFIDVQGRGVFVGDAWTVLNPTQGWWGEGDEKIYVDGAWEEGFPTHFGTGTEDYYGWAGGVVPTRADEFDEPFLANVRVGGLDGGRTRGFNISTRSRVLDAIPFDERLRFDMEISPGTDQRAPTDFLGYSAVVFWYARPGDRHNRPALPDAAARPVMSLADLEAAARRASAVGASGAAPRFVLACDPRNDLWRVLEASGANARRVDDPADAVLEAPRGSAVLILAGADDATSEVAPALVGEAARKGLRLYVERPASLPGLEMGPARPLGWERIVVASDLFGPELAPSSILSVHGARILPAKAAPGANAHLVAARVAGYDRAVLGLPAETWPVLLEPAGDGVLVATCRLSSFVTGRYAPADAWRRAWRGILSRLQPGAAIPDLRWTPTVRPSFGPGEELPPDAEARALRRGAEWFFTAKMLIHPSWARTYDEEAARWPDRTGPMPGADQPAGDGSLGVLEGFHSSVLPDGSQQVRWWRRHDCNGEVAGALAIAGRALDEVRWREASGRIGDFLYERSIISGGERGDPAHPAYGLFGWNDVARYWGQLDGFGVYYGDDNARGILGMIAAGAAHRTDRWEGRALRGLLANVRLSGRLGFIPDRIDEADLERAGWRAYFDASTTSFGGNYQAYPWATYLLAHRHTGLPLFLDRAGKGIRAMMEAYPDRWTPPNGQMQMDRARMLLPLAWLVRAEDTEEHRAWLRRMAGDLLAFQDPSGAIAERVVGGVRERRNEEYGTGETALIHADGDPAADLLYTCNFAFLGLHEAAAATADPFYREAGDRLARFLCRIQARSEARPELDGAWFRGFDFRRWDYWSSSGDAGWGAWSVETGWSQAWIVSVLALRRLETSLWDFTAASGIGRHGSVISAFEGVRVPGLRVSEGNLVKDGRPYRGVGANYYDLYQRVWKDPTDRSSLEGLEKLAGAGIPFVRFACSGFTARDWDRYFADKEEALRRLDLVVRAAERANIGLIPSLFWTFVLHETVSERRDQWGNPDSRTVARMREYVRDIVGRYKDSPAIWAWELGNEANLGVDLPNAAQFRPAGGDERDDLKSEHLVTMLVEFAKAVRAIDPDRAIISGNSHPRATAWHNTRERSWIPDTREQTREIILRDNPAPLDTIGIHIYGGAPVTKDVAAWAQDRGEYLRWLRGLAREVRRPVFVGEFGVESTADAAVDRAGFEELLEAMGGAGIDLAAFWVYDLSFQRTWNVTLDNDRSWMLRAAAEASRRWARAAARSE